MPPLSASIVLFKNNPTQVEKAIHSFLNTAIAVKLFLVDNSPTDDLKNLVADKRIEYIFNPSNPGFGAAHNIAIKKTIAEGYTYHIVLNPDVYFDAGVVETLTTYMEQHKDVGLITPKTLYPTGEIQYLCKMLPTPFDLFARRFIPNFLKPFIQKKLDGYELKHKNYSEPMEIPYVSGSFMFFRISALEKIGLFDENIFMYTEDIDISRRVAKSSKIIFYPPVFIFHNYEKGSYKDIKLTIIHIKSIIYYFNKWGWFFDKKRNQINNSLK